MIDIIIPKEAVEINGFPDYWITPNGVVYSTKRSKVIIIREGRHRQGYKNVHLMDSSGVEKIRYVHRLIAEAFHPNWDESLQVNHINGIKDDNRLSNFEMVTNAQNVQHGFDLGLSKSKVGYQAHRSKLTKEQFDFILATEGVLTAKETVKYIPMHPESIRRIRLKNRTGEYDGALLR